MAHKSLKGRKSQPNSRSLIKKKNNKDKKGKNAGRLSKKERRRLETEAEEAAAGGKKPEVSKEKKARKLSAIEQQHRDLYRTGEKTLLVGEGNFSFTRALCKTFGEGKCADIIATAFDNEAVLKRKYPDVDKVKEEIEKSGATTLTGVDATRLHKIQEFKGAFKKIVFYFPHLGDGEGDVEKSVAQHRKLLAGFFTSAEQCLVQEKGAAIHVALKQGEPYKSWKIGQTARMAAEELDLVTAVPFALSAWEGYAHRRTMGFEAKWSKADNEELKNGAKVYVFTRRRKKEEQ